MNDKQYEILALTLRYWFVLLIVYVFVKSAARTFRDTFSEQPVKRSTGNIPFVLVLFTLTSFGLLAMQDSQGFNLDTAIVGVLASAIILFQFYLMYYLFPGLDEILLLMINTLAILGFVMLQRLTPELALRQVQWFAVGCVILFVTLLVMPRLNNLGKKLHLPLMVLGPAILFFVALFGGESGGATSKLPIGSFSVQPAEFVKAIFILVLADSLKEIKTFREKIPLFLFAAASVLGVVLQKDLGSALHYFIVFLFVYQISTSDWLITLAASGAGVLASVASYRIFPHVQVRVEAWKNPWADIGGRGWQVAQSLMAMGSGGMVIGFYVLILIRSMHKAKLAQRPYDTLLACGSAISLAVQAFIIIGGVVKMIPLTGITLPFISYGGSSMLTSFALLGLILSVSIKNERLTRVTEGYEDFGGYQDAEQEDYEDDDNYEDDEDCEQDMVDEEEEKGRYRGGRKR